MKQERVGFVLSDKMNKTRVVRVERTVRHSMYGKTLNMRGKFYAHDEQNQSKTGDKVRIRATRPLSRTKRWTIVEILKK
ncbi:MAG: 30S ribosomal protein S17 [Elusimicrobia bacterium RIFCSPLOWO2_01_FULL_64_13]|nr:MAG: 30S ribosomal protein S17 [Elusimicrobia bacterium RIFCSPHIGHO2_01_FULL_64_10]OGR95419.1 MAG: 30S ribosomal protein S17 [Elusimicrobia bacterium RIFCSPLOWO2_01_FULL_64_13]